MSDKVRVAIIGVGNCASSLVQGVHYYKNAKEKEFIPGIMHVNLGGYHIRDIEFSAAFDIDKNKVGKDLSEAIWKSRRKQLADARTRLFRLKTEPWRRWANGFSTLAFVLVGAPAAILLKKSDVMTRFGMVFPPILALYYPLFIGCCDRAKAGSLPPYIVWIPNVLLFAFGYWLMKRVVRY